MSRLTVAPLNEYDTSGGRVIITSPYGDGRGHQGVDFGTTDGIEVGTALFAPVDGWIVNTGDDGPWTPSGGHTAGRWLWFAGLDGTRWKMFHLNAVTCAAGVIVPAATPIAEVGNTGTQAAHLHLEEHRDSWSNPIDFTADAYEVLDAGRWPSTHQPPPEDEMTDEDFNRIAQIVGGVLDNRITQFAAPDLVWKDGDDFLFEVLYDGDGRRVRRRLRSGELLALRGGNILAEEPIIDVRAMGEDQQRAVREWPEV
jgi:Peptidase family M23